MDLEEKERTKYSKLYNDDTYRKLGYGSPGIDLIKAFPVLRTLQKFGVETVLDAGCGRGDFIDFITTHTKLNIEGCDLVPPGHKNTYYQCLWNDLPKTYDAIYCADVMEHIPTDKVDDVIINLASHCTKLTIFTISLIDDISGKEIGEVLHLTVQPATWWLLKLQNHFILEYVVFDTNRLNAVCLKEGTHEVDN